jgi:hypothetical protein
LVTVAGSSSQKDSRQILQASSQASCTPPSTNATADDVIDPSSSALFLLLLFLFSHKTPSEPTEKGKTLHDPTNSGAKDYNLGSDTKGEKRKGKDGDVVPE